MRESASNDLPTRSARATAYRFVGWQALIVAIVAALWLLAGVEQAFSVLLGGFACVLPSFLFARRLFRTTSPRAVKKILVTFYLGEIVKLALSAGLVLLFVALVPLAFVPFITGFAGAQLGFWVAPLFLNIDARVINR